MKTSTLFAALCTAAAALCAMSAEAQTAPAAPQAAAAPAPGTPWSLDDCIGYALANNIDVQQRALQVEQNEVELSTAKYSRLPDLNASIGGDASFGRRSPRLGRGSVRLRTAEGGIGPFDHFRFQRCQDPHGKSRVGTRSGEIRIRIPFENTGFLPRETAETVIRAGKQIVHNKQIRAADIDRPDAVRNNQSLKFSGSDRVRFSDSHPAQKPFCVTNYPLHPLCEVG